MTAGPDSLHVLAHRAGAARKDEFDWWGSPVETALGAAAAVRHHSGYRQVAERAVDRLVGWWQQEASRRVSADTVALALTAYAVHALARRDAALAADAAQRVADMARRDPAVVPELHVALAVWALDDLVAERDTAPWPSVRDRLSRGSAHGVDEALRVYARAVAARSFDASGLVRAMLNSAPSSPSVRDGAAVAWVLSVTIERCARSLRPDEPGLLALVDQRARVADRLTVDVSESAFLQPPVVDFDTDADEHVGEVVHISSMEALLLDCALASREPATPWVTFDEARELFGERESASAAREARWRLRASWLVALAGVLAAAVLALVLARYAVDAAVWAPASLAVACVIATVGARVARAAARSRKLVDAVALGLLTEAVVAVVLVVNGVVPEPFIEGAMAFVVGTVPGVLAPAVLLLVVRDD